MLALRRVLFKSRALCRHVYTEAPPASEHILIKDYYKILGVKRGATQKELKLAFVKLTKENHPDFNKSEEAKFTFMEVTEAYDVLRKPMTRQHYNKKLDQIQMDKLNYKVWDEKWIYVKDNKAVNMQYLPPTSMIGIIEKVGTSIICGTIAIVFGIGITLYAIYKEHTGYVDKDWAAYQEFKVATDREALMMILEWKLEEDLDKIKKEILQDIEDEDDEDDDDDDE